MTIYQIDCSVASSGKVMSMTKRRVTWKWGIANEEAMNAGKVGVDCRGYEHEINLVWSIASGKRSVTQDGKSVHYSQGRRGEGKFHHSWVGLNNHVFTVIAHASPPLKHNPGFRQFELLIDGLSLTSFPRIFELAKGVTINHRSKTGATSTRRVPVSTWAARSEYRSDRESSRSISSGDDMKWARSASERSNRREMNSAVYDSKRTVTVATTTTTKPTSPPQQQQPEDLLSSPPESLLDIEYSASKSGSFWDSENTFPSSLSDDFGHNPAQPPSYEQVHNTIMGAYAYEPNTNSTTSAQVVTDMTDMNNLNIYTEFPDGNMKDKEQSSVESPRDVADIDGVLQNLVNLDDISSPVYQQYSAKETEKLVKMERSKKTLSELKCMQNEASSRSHPTKEIMKTHQEYAVAHPGALVVYGQEQQNNNAYNYNAPPLYGSAYGY